MLEDHLKTGHCDANVTKEIGDSNCNDSPTELAKDPLLDDVSDQTFMRDVEKAPSELVEIQMNASDAESSQNDEIQHEPNESVTELSESIIECDACDSTFEDMALFEKHMTDKHPIDNFPIESFLKIEMDHDEESIHQSNEDNSFMGNHIAEKHSTDDSDLFRCNICKLCFMEERFLKKHAKCHDESRKHGCHSCSYRFSKKSQLKKHTKIHLTKPPKESAKNGGVEKRFECDECGKCFKKKDKLTRHSKIHDRDRQSSNDVKKSDDCKIVRKFQCIQCNRFFVNEKTLERHVKIHDMNRPYICHVCHSRFSGEDSLRRHLASHDRKRHEDSKGGRSYKCVECSRYCSTEKTYANHQKLHDMTRPYGCSTCNYRFADRRSLREHEVTHVPKQLRDASVRGRVYKCCQCERKFANEEDLTRHLKLHDVNRLFVCQLCFHRFPHSSALKQHSKTHDPEWRQKRRGLYKCAECPRCFSSDEALAVHMGVHDANRPYCCHLCNYRFAEVKTFQRHVKSHYRDSVIMT